MAVETTRAAMQKVCGRVPSADVIVLGGGPAGCIAAKRLAELGHSVVIVAGRRPGSSLEGLSGRVLEVLTTLGCRNALAATGPSVARVASWNGETSSHNTEHLVDRSRFDVALLADASAAGAVVVAGRAGAVQLASSTWHATGRLDDGGDMEVSAAYLVDARGRGAPRGRAQTVTAPPTLALSRWYVDEVRTPRSAIASCRFGWAWFIALGDGAAVLQLMAATTDVPKGDALQIRFDALRAEVAEADGWLSSMRPVNTVGARDATLRVTRPLLADRSLRVGDAAVAVDPLSGHGVFEAIGSGLAAAPVVHTLLKRPDDASVARRFYEERMEDTFNRYARAGRQFYVSEARWRDEPFWRERAAWPDDRSLHAPPDQAAAAVTARPVIEDGFVMERQVIVTADHPRGVYGIADVPVVSLLQFLDGCRGDSWSAATAAAARHFEKRPEQIDTAIRWLSGRGLLAWADSSVTAAAKQLNADPS